MAHHRASPRCNQRYSHPHHIVPVTFILCASFLVSLSLSGLPSAHARVSSKQLSSYQEIETEAALTSHIAQGLPDDAVSFFIADIPDRYIKGVNGMGAFETNAQYGFVSLGNLLSPAHDHWDTVWHQIDAWWNNQMMVSPLRSYNSEGADIIYVPALFSIKHPDDLNSFVKDANSCLPYLGSKPHVVVLNHAARCRQQDQPAPHTRKQPPLHISQLRAV